jgi:hypothetical protein
VVEKAQLGDIEAQIWASIERGRRECLICRCALP